MAKLHKISATACDDPQRLVDVIFIHGLGGDAHTTWRSEAGDGFFWPGDLAQTFPNVGVWSLSHAASPSRLVGLLDKLRLWRVTDRDAGQAMSLPDRATQVLSRMQHEFSGERPIIFVCHSLGGLLAKQILRKAIDSPNPDLQAIARRTVAVLFLATPHNGATLASMVNRFAAIFGPTTSMRALQAHDPHLRDLYHWYRNHALRSPIETVTYFEGRDVAGFRIVDETSSQPGVGDEPVMLDEDHLSIAKPRSADDDVCVALARLIQATMREPLPSTGTSLPGAPQPRTPPGLELRVDVPMAQKIPLAMNAQQTATPDIPLQLPHSAHRFFGREAAVSDLLQRLREGRTTNVVGEAGMGKTALVAEALRQMLDIDWCSSPRAAIAEMHFSDGIVLLDLYQHHGMADQAWHDIANRLGGAAFLQTQAAQVRAVEACRGKRVLLIVEGGEEAHGGADGSRVRTTRHELLDPLQLAGAVLWMTRRIDQSLPVESIYLDEPLKEDEARQLFDDLSTGRVASEWRDKALALLGGHPLAITWAAALLARGDEPPQNLLDDLQQHPSNLYDPEDARHNLHWLFKRSLHALDDSARRSLLAAGLLATESFSQAAIVAATGLGVETQREALKACVRSGLLRVDLSADVGATAHWRFGHILGYHFARDAAIADVGVCATLLSGLARWAHDHLSSCLAPEQALQSEGQVRRDLQHATALLRADAPMSLWLTLVNPLLYGIAGRFVALGMLDSALLARKAVADWLRRLPLVEADMAIWRGMTAACHSLLGDVMLAQGKLSEAFEQFEAGFSISKRLAADFQENTQFQQSLSVSYNKLGDMLKTLGDLSGAQRYYRSGILIIERLIAQHPANADWRRDLSISQERLGEVLRKQGDLSGAQQCFEASHSIRDRLVTLSPTNNEWQRDLAVSYDTLGDVLLAQHAFQSARRNYEVSLSIRQQLAGQDPANTLWQRDLNSSYARLGALSIRKGDLPDARQHFEAGFLIIERLAKQGSTNSQWQSDLAISQATLGRLLQQEGDLTGARQRYEESLAIARELIIRNPLNPHWQRNLSVCQIYLGSLLLAQGDQQGAKQCFEASLLAFEQIAMKDPANAEWQRELLTTYDMLIPIVQSQGDLLGTQKYFEASLAIRERLVAKNFASTKLHYDLGINCNNLGDLAQEQGDLARAQQHCEAGLSVFERLALQDPANAEWQRALSVSYSKLGDLLQARGDHQDAQRNFESSLTILELLAAQDPENCIRLRDLGAGHHQLGDLLRVMDDPQGAQEHFEVCLAITERLIVQGGAKIEWQHDLAIILSKLAYFRVLQHDQPGAMTHFEQAQGIFRALVQRVPDNPQFRHDLAKLESMLVQQQGAAPTPYG